MRKKLSALILVFVMISGLLPGVSVNAKVNIQIGEYIQIGSYNNKPLLWRCVDIDDTGALMLADEIICNKQFDAAGSNKDGSHAGHWCRPKYGSSYWGDSNIRDWLNSTATSGNVVWSCGNPPSYAQEAGFLSNFTENEQKAIKYVTQTIEYDKWEKGWKNISYESTDQIFLLGISQFYKAAENLGNEYLNKKNDIASQYWLRTRTYSSSQSNIVLCYMCGEENGYVRYDIDMPMYSMGIRPAFYINSASTRIISGSGTFGSPYIVEGKEDPKPTLSPIPTSTPDPYENLEPLPTPEFELNKYRANYVIDNNFTYTIEHTYDTPSRLLYNAGIESGLYNNATLWKTITDTVDGLDDISKIADYQFEEKDMYSAIIFNIFQTSTDFKIVDCINNEITQDTKDWVSTVTSNMKNIYSFDLISSMNLKDMSLNDKEKLKNITENLYKQEHGTAADVSKITSVIEQGIEYAEDVEDFLELIVTYDKIRQLSDATKQVMREMHANCPGDEIALKLALSDCIRVMESSDAEFESNIHLTLAGVVGKDIAQFIVDELWDIATDKLMSMHPAAYVFKVAYDTGKFVCNAVFNTDDITEKYFDMGAIVKTKDILDDTYYDLKTKFRKSKTEVDAEIYNNAIDIMYNMLDADCDYARAFVNSVGDSAAGQINSKLGNTSVEETRKSIDRIQDDYYLDHESLNTSWVFGLEADNYKMYKVYEHLIYESNARIRKKYNINCPVDVYIYNSSGKLEGSIVNNKPYCSDENNLTIVVKGDKKTVYFYDDNEYDIRYVGNDTGTMDIAVTEYDEEQNETRKVNFNNIALSNGTEYTSTDNGSNMSRYVIRDEHSKNVNSDFDSKNTGGKQFTADISRGYFSSFETSKQIYPGENLEIAAYVPDGYGFVKWTTNTGEDIFDDSDSQTTTICMPSEDIKITATIEKRSIAISNVTNSSVTVQTTGCARLSDGTIILAAYDNNGALQYFDTKPVEREVVFNGINGHDYNFKAMLWNSVNEMMPLTDYANKETVFMPSTPTPTPTPTDTPTPTPSSTVTPKPTSTPDIDASDYNIALDKSWYHGGYYDDIPVEIITMTPDEYIEGSHKYVRWIAYLDGYEWQQCAAVYVDGGTIKWNYDINAADLGIPTDMNKLTFAFSLFRSDYFVTGGSLVDRLVTVSIQ